MNEKKITMDGMKVRVKEILKHLCDNDNGGIKIYTDYKDRELSKFFLKEIFACNNPRAFFNDKLDHWAIDYEDQCGLDELETDIRKELSEEEEEFFDENFDEIWDYVKDNSYFYYDSDEFNTAINVNIMVDCGNGNYDYSRDNVLNWDGRYSKGNIEKESSILWLAKTQGKATLLRKACKEAFREDCDYTERKQEKDSFVESCVQELENLPSHMGTLTFLVKMPLFQLFDLIDLQKEEYVENAKYDPRLNKSKSYIILGKETECGLYNPWSGSGSVLEIKLDKNVKLPVKFVEICVEGCEERGYDVNDVYGLIDSCWKESIKEIKKIA